MIAMTKIERLHESAKGAIARCLVRQLTLPKVYFEACWPVGGTRVDVLAVDRDGLGDVHVVEIKKDVDAAAKSLPQVMKIPAAFRWISFFTGASSLSARKVMSDELYPKQGMGRVGVIEVTNSRNKESEASVAIRAERFNISDKKNVANFVASVQADIQYDESDPPDSSKVTEQTLDIEEIHKRLREISTLMKEGHNGAALVLAWSAFEAAMRLTADKLGLSAERRSPSALIRSLLTYNLLDQDEYRSLTEVLQIRNSVAHGFKPPKTLLDLIQRLIDLTHGLIKRRRPGKRATGS